MEAQFNTYFYYSTDLINSSHATKMKSKTLEQISEVHLLKKVVVIAKLVTYVVMFTQKEELEGKLEFR